MNPLLYVVIVLHALLSIGLIVFVLLHSGRGTGLSSMLGGVMDQTAASTSIIERNLDRITIGVACGFAVTSIILMVFYRGVGS